MANFEEKINIILECPYCYENLIINEANVLNLRFFRHGIYKNTGKLINPYISNVVCDRYLLNKKISGCGKYIKITYNDNNYLIEKITI